LLPPSVSECTVTAGGSPSLYPLPFPSHGGRVSDSLADCTTEELFVALSVSVSKLEAVAVIDEDSAVSVSVAVNVPVRDSVEVTTFVSDFVKLKACVKVSKRVSETVSGKVQVALTVTVPTLETPDRDRLLDSVSRETSKSDVFDEE
jgi:hypothetical protein